MNGINVLKRLAQQLRRDLLALSSPARLGVAAGLLAVVLLMTLLALQPSPDEDKAERGLEAPQVIGISTAPSTLRQHPLIYGSIYVDKFYDLNASSRTFSADGSFWLQWPADVQDIITKNDIKIDKLVRLKNQIDQANSSIQLDSEEPVKLSAGRLQQRYIFSSRFYDDAINFKRHPFNRLTLPIVIELMPEVMTSKYMDVLMVPEQRSSSSVGDSDGISGYELIQAKLTAVQQIYRNKFGSWQTPKRSQLRLEATFSANAWSAIINWILPLFIVNAVVLISPSVEGSLGDVRLGIPSTALLTLIFLQQFYHSSLPPLPYTTYLDNLFSASYVIAMALFALFTWGANVYSKAPEVDKARAMKRVNRVDALFQLSSIGALVAVAGLGWLLT